MLGRQACEVCCRANHPLRDNRGDNDTRVKLRPIPALGLFVCESSRSPDIVSGVSAAECACWRLPDHTPCSACGWKKVFPADKLCPIEWAVTEETFVWRQMEESHRMDAKSGKKVSVWCEKTVKGTPHKFMTELQKAYEAVRTHHQLDRFHSAGKAHLRNTLKLNEYCATSDFGMNWGHLFAGTEQKAHWTRPQSSLYVTVVFYLDGDGKLVDETLLHVSPGLAKHGPEFIWAAERDLMNHMTEVAERRNKGPFTLGHRCSDSPSSQFRNRFIANLVVRVLAEDKRATTWNWSVVAHGKSGGADGELHVVKHILRMAEDRGAHPRTLLPSSRIVEYLNSVGSWVRQFKIFFPQGLLS